MGPSGSSGGSQISAYMNQGIPSLPSGFAPGVAVPQAGIPSALDPNQLNLSQVPAMLSWVTNYLNQNPALKSSVMGNQGGGHSQPSVPGYTPPVSSNF